MAAAQNLHHTRKLAFSADDTVQLSLFGFLRQIQAICAEIFALGTPFSLRFLLLLCRIAAIGAGGIFRAICKAAEKFSEINRRGAAVAVFRIILGIALRRLLRDLPVFTDQPHHLIVKLLQGFVVDPHFFENIIHLLDTELFCAAQADSLIDCFIALDPCHIDNGKAFMAS